MLCPSLCWSDYVMSDAGHVRVDLIWPRLQSWNSNDSVCVHHQINSFIQNQTKSRCFSWLLHFSTASASTLHIHCTLCLRCCQNKVPPSELCQWLMCNNCSLSTDYTINISVDISGVWSIINSSTSTLRRIDTGQESVWFKVCETVIISPSYLSSQVPVSSSRYYQQTPARMTQRGHSGRPLASRWQTQTVTCHVSPSRAETAIFMVMGTWYHKFIFVPTNFISNECRGARPPRIFKPIQKREGEGKKNGRNLFRLVAEVARSCSPVSLCWPYVQSWEPSTGHCTQGIFWSPGSISPLGWAWLGTQIHLGSMVTHLFSQ